MVNLVIGHPSCIGLIWYLPMIRISQYVTMIVKQLLRKFTKFITNLLIFPFITCYCDKLESRSRAHLDELIIKRLQLIKNVMIESLYFSQEPT